MGKNTYLDYFKNFMISKIQSMDTDQMVGLIDQLSNYSIFFETSDGKIYEYAMTCKHCPYHNEENGCLGCKVDCKDYYTKLLNSEVKENEK